MSDVKPYTLDEFRKDAEQGEGWGLLENMPDAWVWERRIWATVTALEEARAEHDALLAHAEALAGALALVTEDLECAWTGREPTPAAQKSHAAASIALSQWGEAKGKKP